MLRVSRNGELAGLLNSHSLLYCKKRNCPGHKGVRWDTESEVIKWCDSLKVKFEISALSSIWFSYAAKLARSIESIVIKTIAYGSFLVIKIKS